MLPVKLVRRLLPALLVGLVATRSLAQNDPDIDLWGSFATQPGNPGRMMDMAYTGDGALIVAFVEYVPGPGDDRIVVARREPAGGAFWLISNHAYGFRNVLELSLSVPGRHSSGASMNRVYIAVHFATDVGTGTDWEWAALISGPYDKKWNNPGRMAVAQDLGQPSSSWRAWNPSVAVVPTGPMDFSDHDAVLCFAFPEPGGTSIVRATSLDQGKNLLPSLRVAGPGSSGAAGSGPIDLRQGAYANPSVASDDRNAFLVLGLQDDTRGTVHLVHAEPDSSITTYTFGTLQNDNRRELAPRVASDDNWVVFTCLTDPIAPNGGGRPIYWYSGRSFDTGSWGQRGSLHWRSMTAADVCLREGQMYVAARCRTDNNTTVAPVLAFDAPRDGGQVQMAQVSDYLSWTVQPRVAVTRDGLMPARESQGYTTRDWTKTFQPDGGYVQLDL